MNRTNGEKSSLSVQNLPSSFLTPREREKKKGSPRNLSATNTDFDFTDSLTLQSVSLWGYKTLLHNTLTTGVGDNNSDKEKQCGQHEAKKTIKKYIFYGIFYIFGCWIRIKKIRFFSFR